jgi:hypothetical protein
LWVVKYSEDGMFELCYDNIIENFSNMNSKWFIVIGNIHENPELLKESEEMVVDGVELLRMIRDGELKERTKNQMYR